MPRHTGDDGGLRNKGSVTLSYGGDRSGFPPDPLNLDLSRFHAFEIDVPSLTGTGEVSVVVNSRGFGTSFTRLPLASEGTFRYPFAEIVGSNQIADVESLHFWIIGLTTDFALTVGEIRTVPEPGSLALLQVTLLLALRRRF